MKQQQLQHLQNNNGRGLNGKKIDRGIYATSSTAASIEKQQLRHLRDNIVGSSNATLSTAAPTRHHRPGLKYISNSRGIYGTTSAA